MLDDNGMEPKVPLTAGWLTYMSYRDFGLAADYSGDQLCLSTSWAFKQYAGIFGLSGSVGSPTELAYLKDTFGAVTFPVPRFLQTCAGQPGTDAVNRGVRLLKDRTQQELAIAMLAEEHFERVPVIIITRGTDSEYKDEMGRIEKLLKKRGRIPSQSVLRFAQRDEAGRPCTKATWDSILNDTARPTGVNESRHCRVCVTDKFGGRGQDFSPKDDAIDKAGGVLVIATSIPDEREWIQWKGRTARQDLNGAYYVILSRNDPPFAKAGEGLANDRLIKKIEGDSLTADQKVRELLNVHSEGAQACMDAVRTQQERGEVLNELCVQFYAAYPRPHDDRWPTQPPNKGVTKDKARAEQAAEWNAKDRGLEGILKQRRGTTFELDGKQIKSAASQLGFSL